MTTTEPIPAATDLDAHVTEGFARNRRAESAETSEAQNSSESRDSAPGGVASPPRSVPTGPRGRVTADVDRLGDDFDPYNPNTGNARLDGAVNALGGAVRAFVWFLEATHEGDLRRARRHWLDAQGWAIRAEEWLERAVAS